MKIFTQEQSQAMYDALIHIKEYWNGGSESAVDAIEEAVSTAKETLDIVDGEG